VVITRRGCVLLALAPLLGLPPAGAAQAADEPLAVPAPMPAPMSARYRVTTITAAAPGRAAVKRSSLWTLHRNAEQVALLKGAIDEIWSRDAQGRKSLQRVFHEHRKVTDYSTGELATLGVDADWLALATLVDPHERATLKTTARSGSGATTWLRLEGRRGAERTRIDWLPALQLPALVVRLTGNGSSSRIELLAHAAQPPADWPQPGARSADYLHIDAADFGDMGNEPVVRLSEALDARSGWRQAHAHD
jgi:hypothetical protein